MSIARLPTYYPCARCLHPSIVCVVCPKLTCFHREFSSKDLRNVGSYALGRLIGKGSFGKVYLAYHKLTNGSKVSAAVTC